MKYSIYFVYGHIQNYTRTSCETTLVGSKPHIAARYSFSQQVWLKNLSPLPFSNFSFLMLSVHRHLRCANTIFKTTTQSIKLVIHHSPYSDTESQNEPG